MNQKILNYLKHIKIVYKDEATTLGLKDDIQIKMGLKG